MTRSCRASPPTETNAQPGAEPGRRDTLTIATAIALMLLSGCASPPSSGRVNLIGQRSLEHGQSCPVMTPSGRALAVAPAVTINPAREHSTVGIVIDAGPAGAADDGAEVLIPIIQPGRLMTGDILHHDTVTKRVTTIWTEHHQGNRHLPLAVPLYATFRTNGDTRITPDQMACLTPIRPATAVAVGPR